MADLGGQFDASTVAPLGDRDPIPAGHYECAAIKSEFKNTKDGRGSFLEIVWQILDGIYKGRMLWTRLNLNNSNAQAVSIARSELSAICHATNKLKLRDSSELHDIPIVLSVKLKKREDNGDATNEVSGYQSVKAYHEKRMANSQSTNSTANVDNKKPAWA